MSDILIYIWTVTLSTLGTVLLLVSANDRLLHVVKWNTVVYVLYPVAYIL